MNDFKNRSLNELFKELRQAKKQGVNDVCLKPLFDELDSAHPGWHDEYKRRFKKNRNRRERDQAMRDLGLVKVRGSLGGTYWE